MEAFNKQQAFNSFAENKLWKPHNRKATAYIYSNTETGSGVMIQFEQKENEHILPMPLDLFLEANDLKESDFYNQDDKSASV